MKKKKTRRRAAPRQAPPFFGFKSLGGIILCETGLALEEEKDRHA
jgi:hypothetical protein